MGQLFVSNVAMAQLGSLMEEQLGRSYSGIRRGTTHFDVTIAQLPIQVFVIGEVSAGGVPARLSGDGPQRPVRRGRAS